MGSVLGFAVFLVALQWPAASFAAEQHGSAAEAVALVKKVIGSIKAVGREKTFAEINNLQNTQFRDRDLYVTIVDMDGKSLAHGANARMQGRLLMEMKDADGKAFMRERVTLAKADGKGWQNYKFVNPVSKKIEPKAMYFERFEDIVIACGIYK